MLSCTGYTRVPTIRIRWDLKCDAIKTQDAMDWSTPLLSDVIEEQQSKTKWQLSVTRTEPAEKESKPGLYIIGLRLISGPCQRFRVVATCRGPAVDEDDDIDCRDDEVAVLFSVNDRRPETIYTMMGIEKWERQSGPTSPSSPATIFATLSGTRIIDEHALTYPDEDAHGKHMFEAGATHSDVTVKVGAWTFPAHRYVLATSPVLEKAFTHPATLEREAKEVDWTKCTTVPAAKLLLRCMYTRTLPEAGSGASGASGDSGPGDSGPGASSSSGASNISWHDMFVLYSHAHVLALSHIANAALHALGEYVLLQHADANDVMAALDFLEMQDHIGPETNRAETLRKAFEEHVRRHSVEHVRMLRLKRKATASLKNSSSSTKPKHLQSNNGAKS